MNPLRAVIAAAALCLFSLPSVAGECKGLTSAHCFCRLVGGEHSGTKDNLITPPGWDGKELLTYTIPNKCFNQQIDAADYRLNKGCWLACRNAYGVDGATPDPGMKAAIAGASKKLRAAGYCGGWMNAPSLFAAGTNKYRANTNVGIGVGVGGTVAVVNGQKVCK